MNETRQRTRSASEILRRRLLAGRPERQKEIERERLNADIAQQIYDRRKAAGLTQKALADLVGTTTSVISRLEDADYEGHSLRMLQRIAAALDLHLHVQLVATSDSIDAPVPAASCR